jgi:hypothetical protein
VSAPELSRRSGLALPDDARVLAAVHEDRDGQAYRRYLVVTAGNIRLENTVVIPADAALGVIKSLAPTATPAVSPGAEAHTASWQNGEGPWRATTLVDSEGTYLILEELPSGPG